MAASASTLVGRFAAQPYATTMESLERVREGLPVARLDELAAAIAPDDGNFRYRIVPRATLSRRQGSAVARLSPDESERVVRVAELWNFAVDVFNDEETARGYLLGPHMLLRDRRPIDLITESELGAKLVREQLGKILYGIPV